MRSVHGVKIPDSAFARDAEELAREHCPEFLLAHCQRTYVFGALVAGGAGIEVRDELAYAASILHDIGLTERYADGRRFEVSGASAARDWALGQGLSGDEAQVIWDAIALHTSLGIADERSPECALVYWGAGVDIVGSADLPAAAAEAINTTYPRDGFADGFADLIEAAARREPEVYTQTWMAATAERCCGAPLRTSEHVLRTDPHL